MQWRLVCVRIFVAEKTAKCGEIGTAVEQSIDCGLPPGIKVFIPEMTYVGVKPRAGRTEDQQDVRNAGPVRSRKVYCQ